MEFIIEEMDLNYLNIDSSVETCHCISNCSCDCDDGIW